MLLGLVSLWRKQNCINNLKFSITTVTPPAGAPGLVDVQHAKRYAKWNSLSIGCGHHIRHRHYRQQRHHYRVRFPVYLGSKSHRAVQAAVQAALRNAIESKLFKRGGLWLPLFYLFILLIL